MKELPRIAAALHTQPWAILPEVHASLCQQFEDYCRSGAAGDGVRRSAATYPQPESTAPRAAADDPVGPCWRDDDGNLKSWHEQVQVIGTTAILPIKGILGKHLSTLAMWCGAIDYALIEKQARNIANDPRITDVIVYLDTPGGACVGGLECARAIEAIGTAGKSTLAYTDSTCASAGYFLAAACDQIVAAPSAIIGSISTISSAVDASRAYEEMGLKRLVFRTGRVKAIGQEGEEWTEEFKAEMQRVAEDFSAQFKGFVAARRNLSPELMEGQYWPAAAAPAGIVDDLADSLDEVLAGIVI